MLHYVDTSLLDSQAQTVVNTINTVGVMGKGLAAEFKKRYPEMFKQYQALCQDGRLDVGMLWLWKAPDQWVLNFPTKTHWRQPSKIEYVEAGLMKFVRNYDAKGITEISFPRLGCGNGGLNWDDVRPLMHELLAPLPIRVYIHDYVAEIGVPEHDLSRKNGYPQTYIEFLTDLRRLPYITHGQFFTPETKAEFSAAPSDEEAAVLDIKRDGKRTRIRDDDVFVLWELLSAGPVTKELLVGSAKTEASYLLGLLLELPYIRRMTLRETADAKSKFAIEMSPRRSSSTEDLAGRAAHPQSQLDCL